MTTVRPEHLKPIPALYQLTPNAVRHANAVKTVPPEADPTPEIMPELLNVVPVTIVPTLVVQDRNPSLALPIMLRPVYQQQNAELLVMIASITQLVQRHRNLAITAVLLLTHAVFVRHANLNPLNRLMIRMNVSLITGKKDLLTMVW